MCGLTAKLAKFLLFAINIAIWVCGAVIMGVGIALAVDEEAWSWFESIGGAGMDDGVFSAAVYIMISIGVLLFIVGFLGCCGTCKGNTCMLQTYIIIVSIILALELVGAILAIVFKDSLGEDIKENMRDDIQNDYDGINKTDDGLTLSWNSMQMSLECCGSYNHTDYVGSSWEQAQTDPKDPVPITCCKGTTSNSAGYYSISAQNKETCMTEAALQVPPSPTQLFNQGCYDGLTGWIKEKSDIIIGVLIGLGCVQLFGLITACCVKSSIEDGE